jgi:hypothetical protein
VFHAAVADDDDFGTNRWFNADQHDSGGLDGPMTWSDLCAEMAGFDGPHVLVRAT